MIFPNMPSIKQLVLLLSAAYCPFFLCASVTAETRVALVALNEHGTMRQAIDLATVELAQQSDLVVLERQEIQSVLKEQKRDFREFTSGEQSVTLGRLLSADVFAVCSLSQDKKSTRLVVYETATSVRLLDRNVVVASIEKTAAELSEDIRHAIKKRELLQTSGLHLISFHGHRNVDLPGIWKEWINQTHEQLQQHFSAADELGVLDRTHLQFVNKERMLPIAQVQAQLLASSTNVLVQFSQADMPKTAKITLVVSIPGSSEPQTFVAHLPHDSPHQELAKFTRQVGHEIVNDGVLLSSRKLQNTNQNQRQREASRLRLEAGRLFTRDEWQEAAIFSEATYALQPENHRHLAYLISTLDYYAESILKSSTELIKQSSSDSRIIQAGWLQAIRLLEYRLDLIELLHSRRKHESSWHTVMWKNRGDFPPWHESISEFKHFDAERMPLVVEPFRAHCQRFYRVWFKQILRYVQEQVNDADEASRAIREILHQGRSYLKLISDSPEQWQSRCFEQYDSWREVLRKNSWDRDDPTHVKAILALNRLLDFHKYDLYHFSDKRLLELKQRFESLSQHPSEDIFFPARIQVARLSIRLHKSTTKSIKERNLEIEKHIERLAKPALVRLAEKLPPLSASNVYGRENSLTIKVDYDARILHWTFYLKAVASLHTDYTQRRKTFGLFYEQCMELDVFPPALFYETLPPHNFGRHSHSAISKDNLPERIAIYEKALLQLRAGKGKRSTPQIDELILILQVDLDKEKSLLARFQGVASADRPWKSLILLAGEAGLPEKYHDPTRTRVLGFAERDGHIYYLAQKPTANQNNVEVVAYRLALTDPQKPIRWNQSVAHGQLASLSKEQRGYYNKLRSDSNSNPLVVDEHFLYWNRVGFGILVFPLDGTKPFHIDEQAGLPSNFIHTIVAANSKLYAWVGRPGKESILVAISPTSKAIELLASSERTLSKNELDNSRNPRITRLSYHDAPRNRLLFWINKSIWAWDLEHQQPSELLRIPWKKDHWLRSIVALPHRNSLLINRSLDYWLVDLSQDTWQEIPIATELSLSFGQPTTFLHQQVWLRTPWGRYDLAERTFQEMQLPLSDRQPPPMWWNPWCEVLEGEKQCLIWDSFHLWLAELNHRDKTSEEEKK